MSRKSGRIRGKYHTKKSYPLKLYRIATILIGFYCYYRTNNFWLGICSTILGFCLPFMAYAIRDIIQRLTYRHSSLATIDKMGGVEFENYLKYYFSKLGYKCVVTQASNDYGADLILCQGKEKIVVQAKRYNGKVGIKAVQEVISANVYYHGTKAMVVTNSFFTKQAEELASKGEVELWDRNYLRKYM